MTPGWILIRDFLDHLHLHKTELLDKEGMTLLHIYDLYFRRTPKVPHKTLFVPIVQNRIKANLPAMSRFALVCRSSQTANKFRRGGGETLKGTRALAIAYSKTEMGSVELSCKGGREEERNIKQFITLPVATCLAFASPNKCHWPTSNALALKSTVCVLTKLYFTCHVIIILVFFFQLWKSCKQWTSEICRERTACFRVETFCSEQTSSAGDVQSSSQLPNPYTQMSAAIWSTSVFFSSYL